MSFANDNIRITPTVGMAYTLPVVPVMLLMATNTILPGIYATYHGLSLSMISLVMFLTGLFDAVTDPGVGYLSEQLTYSCGGRLVILDYACLPLLSPGIGVSLEDVHGVGGVSLGEPFHLNDASVF